MKEQRMELKEARFIADIVVVALKPYCDKIEIAGSIRRLKETIGDIDIVVIAKDRWNMDLTLMRMGNYERSGPKIGRIDMVEKKTQLDIYYADEQTWATLLLIRTGSIKNNIRLATLAKKKGWRLAASGDGLFDEEGVRIAGESERSIYEALGLPYQEPWEREC